MPSSPHSFLWVFLGGGLGSALRFLIQQEVTRRWASSLPLGTLCVNGMGALAMGALVGVAPAAPYWRLAFGAGFLGGFTTYSAFNQETLTLMQAGEWGRAAAYVLSTLVGAWALGVLGFSAARWLFPTA